MIMAPFTPRERADEYLMSRYGVDLSPLIGRTVVPTMGTDAHLWAAITCHELAWTIARCQTRMRHLGDTLARYAEYPEDMAAWVTTTASEMHVCRAESDTAKRLLDMLINAFTSEKGN